MFAIPPEMVAAIAAFAPVFSQQRVWRTAQTLLWGTILAQGRRTVTSALRASGRSHEQHFTSFHRVLNRVRWSSMLTSSRILLRRLLASFVPASATVVFAIDDFIERRSSARLFGLGAYRDPVQSSQHHQVTCFGLRWLVASLCVSIPGAGRRWALPVLSVLCHPPQVKTRNAKSAKAAKAKGAKRATPARRARIKHGGLSSRPLSTAQRPFVPTPAQRQQHQPDRPRRHKTTIDVAAQVLSALARWLPERQVVAVLDGAYFSYKLLRHAERVGVWVVTRGRWAMVLYDEPAPRAASARGPAPSRGARRGSLRQIVEAEGTPWRAVEIAWYGGERKRFEVATGTGLWSHNRQQAIRLRWVVTRDLEPDPRKRLREEVFVTTWTEASAEQLLEWYVWRWSQEVTFEESRRHLGLQTQRSWTRRAITRTTPALLGIFSIVTLLAVRPGQPQVARQAAAWYPKTELTFSDCLAWVRRQLWRQRYLHAIGPKADGEEFSAEALDRLLDLLPLSA